MDQELIARAQAGDQSAFEALVAADHPRLFRVAHGILGDPHQAEDASQQAYLDIWRNLHRLREPSRFEVWSYRILVNACYAEVRRRPRWVYESEVHPLQEPRAVDAYASVDERDRLERAFQRLSVEHRAVVVMRYLLDMTPDEVAEVLGIPRRTVYSRLKRAMPVLRAALEADARRALRVPATSEALR